MLFLITKLDFWWIGFNLLTLFNSWLLNHHRAIIIINRITFNYLLLIIKSKYVLQMTFEPLISVISQANQPRQQHHRNSSNRSWVWACQNWGKNCCRHNSQQPRYVQQECLMGFLKMFLKWQLGSWRWGYFCYT